jgi:CzcA family heavy metal efflux pump
MRSIVAWSVRLRVLVLGIALAIVVLGITQLPNSSIDALPEFSPPYVEIQTEALGLSAEEVEQLITVPLEADLLNGVAWLESIESESITGLSSIILTFEPGTDPIRARQMVAERLTQAHALPNVSKPPTMLQPLSSSNRLMMVSLSSDELSLIEMSVLARWNIRPRLMGVEGVANVAIWGQRERQLQVLVDPARLRDEGVSLSDVVNTTGNALWVSPLTYLEASTPGTGGFIDTPNQRLSVQHILPIDSADDLAQVPIESDDSEGPSLMLGDVAEVVEDHQPLIGDALVNDVPGLLLVVEKFPEANTLEVTRAVEDALEAMGPGLTGIQIDSSVFRPATFLESAVDNVTLAVIIGLILVAVVMAGLLLDWRAAVISFVAIPLSLVVGALVLHALGAPVNAMVLAGFVAAIGVLVDDAVVGTTSVLSRLRSSEADRGGASTIAQVVQAILDVRGPMVYATLVIGLVIVPLLLIGDVAGALLPAILVAYLAALLASMLVSLTLTPALALALLSGRPIKGHESRLALRLKALYGAALAKLFDRRRSAFVTLGVVTAGVVVLFVTSMAPQLGRAGPPAFHARDVLIHWDGAPGTSHTEMSRIVAQAGSELRSVQGVRSVGAHIGRAVTSDQIVGVNAGEIWLSIEPDADYDATLASVQEVIDGYPGLRRDVVTYPAERVNQVLGGRQEDIAVRIFGQDLDTMRDKAQEISGLLAGIDGISQASVEPQVDEPTVEVEVDLAAAGRHGLKPGDIRRAATTLLSGIEVGSLFEAQKVFEVVVWGTPEMRQNLTTIQELLIETPEGDLVRLGEVADVRIAPSAAVIRRDAVQRAIDVGVTVAGRDVGSILRDVEAALATVEFPLETHAEILGHTAERQAAQGTLLSVIAATAIGMFLVLQAVFASWRLALFVFLSLPAALAGGVLVAFATGDPGSLGAAAGLLAVLGIAVRNGILLIDHCRQLQREQGTEFGPSLVAQGARDRLSPTLMSGLATAAAVLPFAVLPDLTGIEIVHQMSLVILGGLVTSTLLTLFIVPPLFLTSRPSPEPEEVATPIEQAAEPQVIGAG